MIYYNKTPYEIVCRCTGDKLVYYDKNKNRKENGKRTKN